MKLTETLRGAVIATLLAIAGLQDVAAQDRKNSDPPAPTVPEVVAEAFRFGDFAELERLYAVYGKAGVRSNLTGAPRVKHFWMGISKVANYNLRVTDNYYTQLDALAGKWARDQPQSVLAQLLYARVLQAHGWKFRGGGYADTVSPAAWAEFKRYVGLAADQLAGCEALASKDSSWNDLMLSVGQDLNWDRQQLLAIFAKGIDKNPDNDDLYFDMQTVLLPKWGGDLPSVDRFIAYAVNRTREQHGMEMYARLYASVSYQQVKQNLFTTTQATWVGMKAGFDDLLKRYPHTDHRNMYAYFACMADDRSTFKEQVNLIGDHFERIFWGDSPEITFEICKKTAEQPPEASKDGHDAKV